jgi:catalase
VKFHFRTQQGIENFTEEEAIQVIGRDRESSQRDLFDNIEKGNFPKWKFYIQVMTEEQAKTYRFHPFDLTKVWSKKDFPLIEVGEFELNRNPENYFQDVEQAAFNPTNIVPGIGFSPDKMLQGRLFSYGDAQRYRLGVNHFQIPVNKPTCPYHAFHRDGQMRVDGNYGGTKHYEPNSYGEWQEQPEYKEPPLDLYGTAYEHNFRDDDQDYYTQPGDLFRIIKADGKAEELFKNTAVNISGAEKFIQIRHIRNCYKADPDYGKGVAYTLGLDWDEVENFDMTPYDRWAPRPSQQGQH